MNPQTTTHTATLITGTGQTNSKPLTMLPFSKAIASGDILLRDTTTPKEADGVRIIDALPRKVDSIDFLTGGYCVAKCYGPHREDIAQLIVRAVNSHAQLVAALENAETALYRLNGSDDLPGWLSGVVVEARRALSLAKS